MTFQPEKPKKEKQYKQMYVVTDDSGRMVGCCHTKSDAVTLCACLGIDDTSGHISGINVITFHTYHEKDEHKEPVYR